MHRLTARPVAIWLLLLFFGCDGAGASAVERPCVPGQTVECACPGGELGAQACADDGWSFGPCLCVDHSMDTNSGDDIEDGSPDVTDAADTTEDTRSSDAADTDDAIEAADVDDSSDIADTHGETDAGDSNDVFDTSDDSGEALDTDEDGIHDAIDNCPETANNGQADLDSDGRGDACDACPRDPAKTEDGVCGCGVPDSDPDEDGEPTCVDVCPDDSMNDADADGVCASEGDCDDTDSRRFPGAVEVCDWLDNDCNVEVDDGCSEPFVQRLRAPDAAEGDQFGNSVAIDGDVMAVAAHEDDTALHDFAGSVHIYRLGPRGWEWEQQVTAPESSRGLRFGTRVALFGDTLVVGEPSYDLPIRDAGRVWTFSHGPSGWTPDGVLSPDDPVELGQFGTGLAFDGRTLAVGEVYGNSPSAPRSGSVALFERVDSSWIRMDTLYPSDADDEERFGFRVAVSGDVVVVAAPWQEPAGMAYVYRRSGEGWRQEARLVGSGIEADVGAGYAMDVAASGDYVAVSAFREDTEFSERAGVVYIYYWNGSSWEEQARVLSPDAPAWSDFGVSIAMTADRLAVGAGNWSHERGTGSFFMYSRTGSDWVESMRIDSEVERELLGSSIATDGLGTVSGARNAGDWADDSGAAYYMGLLP